MPDDCTFCHRDIPGPCKTQELANSCANLVAMRASHARLRDSEEGVRRLGYTEYIDHDND